MKEFIIENFDINSDNLSVEIDYYFFSELKNIVFTQEQIKEVFRPNNMFEWLVEEFNDDNCVKLLKHFIREYKPRLVKVK